MQDGVEGIWQEVVVICYLVGMRRENAGWSWEYLASSYRYSLLGWTEEGKYGMELRVLSSKLSLVISYWVGYQVPDGMQCNAW